MAHQVVYIQQHSSLTFGNRHGDILDPDDSPECELESERPGALRTLSHSGHCRNQTTLALRTFSRSNHICTQDTVALKTLSAVQRTGKLARGLHIHLLLDCSSYSDHGTAQAPKLRGQSVQSTANTTNICERCESVQRTTHTTNDFEQKESASYFNYLAGRAMHPLTFCKLMQLFLFFILIFLPETSSFWLPDWSNQIDLNRDSRSPK